MLIFFPFPAASISTKAKWKFKSLWWLAANIAFCNGFGVPSKQRTILQCAADSTIVYLTDVSVQSASHYWTKQNFWWSWENRVTWGRKQRFPYLALCISSPAGILITERLFAEWDPTQHECSWNKSYIIKERKGINDLSNTLQLLSHNFVIHSQVLFLQILSAEIGGKKKPTNNKPTAESLQITHGRKELFLVLRGCWENNAASWSGS